jgi:hypothetical protein
LSQLRVKRAQSEEAFLFAPPHGDLLFTHHLVPDGSPVKEGVERTCPATRERTFHSEQWIKTLKAAIEIIPNPLQAPPCGTESIAVQVVNP